MGTIDWSAVRAAEFPVSRNWAYFDHAAVAPLPRRAGDRMRDWVAEQEANGVVNWPSWERKLRELKRGLAEMIGASPDEVAFVNSTTQGIGLVAEGFPWREGDNVVTAEEEYPSNIYPWMNLASRGVSLRTVPSREGRVWVEDLARAMDERTRVLTISHVEWASGFRNDLDALAELCEQRGVALFVDAIQGLGPLTLDVGGRGSTFWRRMGTSGCWGRRGRDFCTCGRTGLSGCRTLGVGWHSVTTSYNTPGIHFELKPTAETVGGRVVQHAGSCRRSGRA